MKKKKKQPTRPAPVAITADPCPTICQNSRTPRHRKLPSTIARPNHPLHLFRDIIGQLHSYTILWFETAKKNGCPIFLQVDHLAKAVLLWMCLLNSVQYENVLNVFFQCKLDWTIYWVYNNFHYLKYLLWLALFFSMASNDPIPLYFFSRTPSAKKYSPGASEVPANMDPIITAKQRTKWAAARQYQQTKLSVCPAKT